MPTKISWTDETWNPILGCDRVSGGCLNCYAIKEVHRMAGNPNAKIKAANQGLTLKHGNGQLDWSGKLRFIPARLDQPARWKAPRRIFVNSLGDVFHDDVEMRHLAAIWSVMALTPHHTYQILTKRPENILPMLSQSGFYQAVLWQADHTVRANHLQLTSIGISNPATMPLQNVWIGTSVEDQGAADKRIPHLLRAPARVRFLSCEPLLGNVDLDTWVWNKDYHGPKLSWVIIGGESGPRARPMDADWVSHLLTSCVGGDVAVFMKQTGTVWAREHGYQDRKGGTPDEWPLGWRMQYFPVSA